MVKMFVSYYPVIPFLEIRQQKEMFALVYKDTSTKIFIVASTNSKKQRMNCVLKNKNK